MIGGTIITVSESTMTGAERWDVSIVSVVSAITNDRDRKWSEVNISTLNVINNDRGRKMCLGCCGGEVDGAVGGGG